MYNRSDDDEKKLFSTLRLATQRYYHIALNKEGKASLQKVDKNSSIDSIHHHLVQIIAQKQSNQETSQTLYCLIPTGYRPTYRGFAALLQDYLRTDELKLTRHSQAIALEKTVVPIKWRQEKNQVFIVTLPAHISPKKLYRPKQKLEVTETASSQDNDFLELVDTASPLKKYCPELLEKFGNDLTKCQPEECDIYKVAKRLDIHTHPNLQIGEEQKSQLKKYRQHLFKFLHGKKPSCPLKNCPVKQKWADNQNLNPADRCHSYLFEHFGRARTQDSKQNQEGNLFSYEAKFAKMNRLDLLELNPLLCLQDPRFLLKKLLIEVMNNTLTLPGSEEDYEKIRTVKYVTEQEFPFMKDVYEKVESGKHKQLGNPLNIAEMCVMIFYTIGANGDTALYSDLGRAQRSGDFDRWKVWDQLLMSAILKLHLAEMKNKKKIPRFYDKENKVLSQLYSGLKNIQFDQKEKIGFFKTYVSTSWDKNVAVTFALQNADKGMLMFLSYDVVETFPNCCVDWISPFPESEILFARSADILGFPSLKWKGKVKKEELKGRRLQSVNFTPAAMPLVVEKGTTHQLDGTKEHQFSYIKLEDNATLTVTP